MFWNNTTLSRSPQEILALASSLSIIIILSISGNALVIYVFITNRQLCSSLSNKLILSLAVADLTTAAFPMLYQLITVADVSLIQHGGPLCSVGGVASYSFFFVSVITLVMLSVERFLALGFPLKYSSIVSRRVKAFIIWYPWLHSLVFAVLCLAWFGIKYDPHGFDCGLRWRTRPFYFTFSVVFIHIALPLTLLTALNICTLCLVRRQHQRIANTCKTAGVNNTMANEKRALAEAKLTRVSMIIIFVFLICWSPYVVTRALAFINVKLSSAVMSAGAWVVHSSSFVNPIIYSSLRSDIRQAMRAVFRCCHVTSTHHHGSITNVANNFTNGDMKTTDITSKTTYAMSIR
ncbi:rhodopsin, GQ-coupled-like [Nematostella vectensis]|uniref:rhodopsin, GQ-coupled-like n=1 Tax=Nematostella vectensis TaxID=45351 RepID=UPI0020779A53|nr:rhodopsin, GQ-coupled-like [Nematostella vectensis]